MARMDELENAVRLLENEDWSRLPHGGDITTAILMCAAVVAGREASNNWNFHAEDTPLIVNVLRRGFTVHANCQALVDADEEMAETVSRLIEHKVSPYIREDVIDAMAKELIDRSGQNGNTVVWYEDTDVPNPLDRRIGIVVFGKKV